MYQIRRSVLFIAGLTIMALIALAMAGCGNSNGGRSGPPVAPSPNPTPSPNPAPPSNESLLTFYVTDSGASKLASITASSDNYKIVGQTVGSNSELLVTVENNERSGVFRISKEGYLDAIVYLSGVSGDRSRPVVLQQTPQAIQADATTGGTYASAKGALVSIDPTSLVDANGQRVDGSFELYVSTVDISDPVERNAFPGSFAGLARDDTEPGRLLSYGVMTVDLVQNGQDLQLAEGQTAQLTLPIFASHFPNGNEIVIGDEITFWILNEATGIWDEESVGTVVEAPLSPTGLALQATTTHFTTFNADLWGSTNAQLNGPSGGSRPRRPRMCELSITIPDMPVGALFTLSVDMFTAFGATTSASRSGVYDGVISLPVFSGVPGRVVVEQHTLDVSTGSRFLCEGTALNLELELSSEPTFLNWFVENEPVFGDNDDDGLQEVISNVVTISTVFGGDEDKMAEVTTNHGQRLLVPSGSAQELQPYFSSDPNPLMVAGYVEDKDGVQDTRLTEVPYIDEAPPTVNFAYLQIINAADPANIEHSLTFDLEGADQLELLYLGTDRDNTGVVVMTTPLTDENNVGAQELQLIELLESSYYEIRFSNRFGTTSRFARVFEGGEVDCTFISDIPCEA